MLDKGLKDFIENSKWKFAKTMAAMPHSYIVKENVDPKLFEKLVLYIRKHGKNREFRIFKHRKIYQYLDYKNYEYWTMGSPLNETIIINRAIKKDDFL
jgi:phosphoenolpyruvate synthase/pyruvate phosphate dikinase